MTEELADQLDWHADYSMATLVLHINREVIHRGAEIACIRDLYTHTQKEN